MMTQQDFQQLPASIQREFTLNACVQLITLEIDQDVLIELFYSYNGNFFIELYTNAGGDIIMDINSFNFSCQTIEKYLFDIDISSIYNRLSDID
jgi:hypothetical protein